MHNRSKEDHCSPKYDVPLRQRQSTFPRYSRGCGTRYRGDTVTLNPLPRYYREFKSHCRGKTADTAVIPQISLRCHSLNGSRRKVAGKSRGCRSRSCVTVSTVALRKMQVDVVLQSYCVRRDRDLTDGTTTELIRPGDLPVLSISLSLSLSYIEFPLVLFLLCACN